MFTRRSLVAAVTIATLSGMTVAGLYAADAEAQELTEVRLAQPTESLSYMALFLARAQGWFEEEGIDLEVIVTRGDGPDVRALLAHEVEFVVTPPTHLFTGYHQGVDLKCVAAVVNRLAINLVIRKDVAEERSITEESSLDEKLQALEGLKIGVTGPGSLTFNIADHYIRRAGYIPQEHVEIVPSGTGPSAIAAIENNVVQLYAYASPINEQMNERGATQNFIMNVRAEDPDFAEFLHACLYVRPDYAAENPEIVQKVVDTVVRASAWIKEHSPEEVADALRPFFSDMDRSILVPAIANVSQALSQDGRITEAMVDSFQEFIIETGTIDEKVPFEAVIDNSFVPEQS